jgi:hypothetical protein
MHAPSPLALICVTLGVCAPASAETLLFAHGSDELHLQTMQETVATDVSYWAPLDFHPASLAMLRVAGLEIEDTGDVAGDDAGTSADVNPLLTVTLFVGAHGQPNLFCTILDRLQIRTRIFRD